MTEEIEVVLKELLYDDRVYEYSKYESCLVKEIEERESFVLSLVLDKCLYYGISPIFIYLLDDKLDDDSLNLLFEISLMYKKKYLTEDEFLDFFDFLCSKKKSISEICKMVLEKLKFVFTSKSMKKNALFVYEELLFKFSATPMLDSCSLLTKKPLSVKIQPSTLVPCDYNISKTTLRLCLNRLKINKSRMTIFSTLTRLMLLYDSDLEVKEVIECLDYNSLSIDDFYNVVDSILFKLDSELELSAHY